MRRPLRTLTAVMLVALARARPTSLSAGELGICLGELAPDCQVEYEELVLAVHRAELTKLPRPLREIMTRVLDEQSHVQSRMSST